MQWAVVLNPWLEQCQQVEDTSKDRAVVEEVDTKTKDTEEVISARHT